jgi:hypothetical protein
MDEWLSPRRVAASRRVSHATVLYWIATGQLQAVDHSKRRGGRPRWRIGAAALAEFDRRRSNRAFLPPLRPQRPRRASPDVIEFF